ncbi:MAG: cobalamin biosynthesis protein CobN, partial [Desulfobulbus sp.]
MQSLRFCYFSATATEIPSLSEGVRLFLDQGRPLKVHARTQVQLFDRRQQQAFVRDALASEVVIISLHGGRASFPAFDLLKEALDALPKEKRPLIHVQPTGGDEDSIEAAREFSTEFGTSEWDQVKRYLQYG